MGVRGGDVVPGSGEGEFGLELWLEILSIVLILLLGMNRGKRLKEREAYHAVDL